MQPSLPAATAPVKQYVHRLVTDRNVEVARRQVREDREKVASFRTERTKHLVKVQLLDHRVEGGKVQSRAVLSRW